MTLPEIALATRPDRIVALVDPDVRVDLLASLSVEGARSRMPRVTSNLSSRLQPIALTGMFGIYFPDRRIWFQEQGTRPFTMRNLPRNKAIPMWINDPDGRVKRENPKAETRRTDDGRQQTKIFRRVAPDRSRMQRDGRSVPRSFPGAPGRIARRDASGQIAGGNVGVRWRHPGIEPRRFMADAITAVADRYRVEVEALYLADSATLYLLQQKSNARSR